MNRLYRKFSENGIRIIFGNEDVPGFLRIIFKGCVGQSRAVETVLKSSAVDTQLE